MKFIIEDNSLYALVVPAKTQQEALERAEQVSPPRIKFKKPCPFSYTVGFRLTDANSIVDRRGDFNLVARVMSIKFDIEANSPREAVKAFDKWNRRGKYTFEQPMDLPEDCDWTMPKHVELYVW